MNIPHLKGATKLCLVVNIIGLFCLLVRTIFAQNPPLYDEPLHLADAEEFLHGFSLSLFRSPDTATGPLYSILHYLLEPITHLEVPGIRLVNICLLFLMVIVLFWTLRQLKYQNALVSSLSIMAAPIIWPVAGMALTEIPAMFFCSIAILLLLLSIDANQKKQLNSLLLALLGGLAFGFSILGRQTFLVLLLALPLLILKDTRRSWRYVLAFFGTAIILPAIQFYLWGGLVPPARASLGIGLAIDHGLLSYSYAGIIFLILSPRWFSLGFKANAGIFVAAVLYNLLFGFIEITPAYSVAQNLLAEPWLQIYSRTVSSIIMALGIIWAASSINNMRKNRNDRIFLFLCCSVLLVCATPAKITHLFSSRYTATAIPLIILVVNKYSQETYSKAIRMAMGNTLGFLSLSSYFW